MYLLSQIDELKGHFKTHLRIRIDSWMRKLAEHQINIMRKRDRNCYTEYMLFCLEKEELDAPFDKLPPDQLLKPEHFPFVSVLAWIVEVIARR